MFSLFSLFSLFSFVVVENYHTCVDTKPHTRLFCLNFFNLIFSLLFFIYSYNAKEPSGGGTDDEGGIELEEGQKWEPHRSQHAGEEAAKNQEKLKAAKREKKEQERREAEQNEPQEQAAVIEEEYHEEEEEGIEEEMTSKEMRAEIIATLGRIGNPDSLMKVMEYARRIEEQDEEDDFENVGKDEL